MNLPKYIPGQVIASDHGMIVVERSWLNPNNVWEYNYEMSEDDVTHVLNGHIWVPAERWNGPTQAVDRSKDVLDAMPRRIEVEDGN